MGCLIRHRNVIAGPKRVTPCSDDALIDQHRSSCAISVSTTTAHNMAALGAPPEWQNEIRARLMAQQTVTEPLKDVIEQCKFTAIWLN